LSDCTCLVHASLIHIPTNAFATDSRQEPDDLVRQVRICAGGGWKQPSLPRSTLLDQDWSVVVPAAVVFRQHGAAISEVCTLRKSPAICRIQPPGNGLKVVCPHALLLFFYGVYPQIIAGCVGGVGSGEGDVSARRATHLWCASRFGGQAYGTQHSLGSRQRHDRQRFETICNNCFGCFIFMACILRQHVVRWRCGLRRGCVSARRATHLWCASRFGGQAYGTQHSLGSRQRHDRQRFETICNNCFGCFIFMACILGQNLVRWRCGLRRGPRFRLSPFALRNNVLSQGEGRQIERADGWRFETLVSVVGFLGTTTNVTRVKDSFDF
jgi:hypothetical protein